MSICQRLAVVVSEFKEKLFLTVIDKLVFGLLIVLAAFLLNLTLERYRADQATKAEIAKLRVGRIATVWAELEKQQDLLNRTAEASRRYVRVLLQTSELIKRTGIFRGEATARGVREVVAASRRAQRLDSRGKTQVAAIREGSERLVALVRETDSGLGLTLLDSTTATSMFRIKC